MSFRVKKDDNVVVIAGKEKGKTGKVMHVDPEKGFVKVENTNMVSRHRKPRSAQDAGGIAKMEGNIHISNVQIICPSCNKATRIGVKLEGDKKLRVCKHCGAELDVKTEKTTKKAATKKTKTETSVSKSDSRVKRTRKSKAETADKSEN